VRNWVTRVVLGALGSAIIGTVANAAKSAWSSGRERVKSGDVDFTRLFIALFIDLAGDSSYLLPGVGEGEDLVWAPVSAVAVWALFDSQALAKLDFLKEMLPFTDVLPVATLGWVLKNIYPDAAITKWFGLAPDEKEDVSPPWDPST
jgi:hypothetical protein